MTVTDSAPAARPNTHEMVIVHNVFRRLFGDLPMLVRQVAEGDQIRAARLCETVDELTTGLEHHHTGEDELLWPTLLERIGPECGTVLRAEEQHERVHELLELARTQVPAFRAGAHAADRDALAATLSELDTVLREHMGDEERYVLPLVEQHLTVAEWAALGERGRASIPKDRLLTQLGWMLDGTSGAERREFLGQMPLVARVAWHLVGKRKFAKEKAEVYGR